MTKVIVWVFFVLFLFASTGYWYLTVYQEGYQGSLNMEGEDLIVFDFDGTLCDSFALFIKLYNALCLEMNLKKVETEEVDSIRDFSTQETLKNHGVSFFKLPLITYKIKQNATPYMQELTPFPHIKEVISQLKQRGFKVGILTSNSLKNVDLFLDKYHLDFFDFIYHGSTVFGKTRLLKKIKKKSKPASMYYVGDENRDIEAAKEADVTSIAVTWGYQSKKLLSQYEPHYLIDSMTTLLEIFELPQEKRLTR